MGLTRVVECDYTITAAFLFTRKYGSVHNSLYTTQVDMFCETRPRSPPDAYITAPAVKSWRILNNKARCDSTSCNSLMLQPADRFTAICDVQYMLSPLMPPMNAQHPPRRDAHTSRISHARAMRGAAEKDTEASRLCLTDLAEN